MQKALLTFTDNPNGTVGINLTFEPEIKISDEITPAISMAFEALDSLIARIPASDEEE